MTQDVTQALLRIKQLAQPYVESLGLGLWGLEFASGAGRPTLRVFIDAPGQAAPDGDSLAGAPRGVDVEQCAQVSRQLSLALDMEDVLHGAYHLEVSSPGLERRFFEFSQLAPYIGRELDVTLTGPLDGRKRFKGVLTALAGQNVSLHAEGSVRNFSWDQVVKARLVHHFETPEESKAKARGKKTFKESQAAPRDGD